MRPLAMQNMDQRVLDDLAVATNLLAILPTRTVETFNQTHTGPVMVGGQPYWSCHSVTRFLKPYLRCDWDVYDGYFALRGCEHSWLHCAMPNVNVILDVMPVAVATGPLLIDIGYYGSPWKNLYMEDRMTMKVRESLFELEVSFITQALEVPDGIASVPVAKRY